MMREQLMNNRIRDLIKKDIFMETIQNVVHDNTSPQNRNRLLQKNNLNLSINKVVLKGGEKDEKQ